jgi:hypothetical protein
VMAVVVFGVLASACGSGGVAQRAQPTCEVHQSLNALVLEAQSVPSADRVPCVATLPAGWRISSTHFRRGRSEFALANDRAGVHALVVRLTSTCDTKGTTEIPSNELGARRYERIVEVTPGFSSVRYYAFAGGCVSYQFHLARAGRALVNEGSLAVGFMPRPRLDAEVRKVSNGHDRL